MALPANAAALDGSDSWLGDRYIVYMDAARAGSHAQYYLLYDTQTQRTISSTLDNQLIAGWEVHGTSLYFAPYIISLGSGVFVPGEIRRFDLASNQITTVFTVTVGELVSQGISSANWNISADGRKIVYYFFVGALAIARRASRAKPSIKTPAAGSR